MAAHDTAIGLGGLRRGNILNPSWTAHKSCASFYRTGRDMGAYVTDNSLPKGLRSVIERSKVSLSIADYTTEDCPLVGINDRFCEMTGYGPSAALGRNCRFLQPPGGAGPVRERMRTFLEDTTVEDGKFLVPNVRLSGEPFLNLVYMTKLSREGEVVAVLGSQFAVDLKGEQKTAIYERALLEDLRILKDALGDSAVFLLGSYEALASSHSIIAKARLEESDEEE